MKWLYIASCIFFTVAGQILVKKGVNSLRDAISFWEYIFNLYVIIGFVMAVIAAASWIKTLQHYNLSYAYPFMSVSFPLVAIISVFYFDEIVKLNQWIGLALVLIGLYIGSR